VCAKAKDYARCYGAPRTEICDSGLFLFTHSFKFKGKSSITHALRAVGERSPKTLLPPINPYLDVSWLKDKSLADLDNLPDADVLAEEIAENLESALDGFKNIIAQLKK
jgi:hypothetical protein